MIELEILAGGKRAGSRSREPAVASAGSASIELPAVIAIIEILAALQLPALIVARKK